jgi:hypothetical protein
MLYLRFGHSQQPAEWVFKYDSKPLCHKIYYMSNILSHQNFQEWVSSTNGCQCSISQSWCLPHIYADKIPTLTKGLQASIGELCTKRTFRNAFSHFVFGVFNKSYLFTTFYRDALDALTVMGHKLQRCISDLWIVQDQLGEICTFLNKHIQRLTFEKITENQMFCWHFRLAIDITYSWKQLEKRLMLGSNINAWME